MILTACEIKCFYVEHRGAASVSTGHWLRRRELEAEISGQTVDLGQVS